MTPAAIQRATCSERSNTGGRAVPAAVIPALGSLSLGQLIRSTPARLTYRYTPELEDSMLLVTARSNDLPWPVQSTCSPRPADQRGSLKVMTNPYVPLSFIGWIGLFVEPLVTKRMRRVAM